MHRVRLPLGVPAESQSAQGQGDRRDQSAAGGPILFAGGPVADQGKRLHGGRPRARRAEPRAGRGVRGGARLRRRRPIGGLGATWLHAFFHGHFCSLLREKTDFSRGETVMKWILPRGAVFALRRSLSRNRSPTPKTARKTQNATNSFLFPEGFISFFSSPPTRAGRLSSKFASRPAPRTAQCLAPRLSQGRFLGSAPLAAQ